MNKTTIIISSLALLGLVILAVAYFRYAMERPLYQPGMVRAANNLRAPLTPPEEQPDNENIWQVETDIQLYHFSAGEGRNVLIIHGGPALVIHGADDLQTEATSRIYVDAFPNARFRVVENAGHFAFQEQPEEFSAIVVEFLGKLKNQ